MSLIMRPFILPRYWFIEFKTVSVKKCNVRRLGEISNLFIIKKWHLLGKHCLSYYAIPINIKGPNISSKMFAVPWSLLNRKKKVIGKKMTRLCNSLLNWLGHVIWKFISKRLHCREKIEVKSEKGQGFCILAVNK